MAKFISPSRKALRITFAYAVVTVFWVTVTDLITEIYIQNPDFKFQASLYKGWVFIGATSVLLFFYLRQDFEKLQTTLNTAIKNEHLLNKVLETIPVGIWLLDADGKIYQGNPEGIRIWGGMREVGVEDFGIFKGWRLPQDELITAKDWGGAKAVLDGTRTLNEEIRIQALDGENRYILHSAVPLRDDQNAISGAIEVNQDITEHKLAERSFKTTEELLSKILENAPTPIFVTSAEGRIRLVNRAWVNAVGMSSTQVVGLNADQVFPPEIAKEYLENNRKVLETQSVIKTEEHFEVDNVQRVYEVVKFPIFDAEEKKMATAGITIDVTERKKMEKDLQEYNKRLTTLASDMTLAEERERRNIAIGLHDEIGQPLALAQIRLGQIIADEGCDDLHRVAHEVRGLIDEAIQKVRTLTFDLSPPILYEFGLEAALHSLAESFSSQHGINADFDSESEISSLDQNLKVLLYHIVRELLVNTIKHAQATEVDIRLKNDGKAIYLAVEDNGIGFSTQQMEKQGFGFFSIRERLKTYGGDLNIESDPGRGVRCTITVPVIKTEPAERKNV